jgi:hypothetical protein
MKIATAKAIQAIQNPTERTTGCAITKSSAFQRIRPLLGTIKVPVETAIVRAENHQ